MPRVSIEEIHGAVADTNTPQLFLKLAGEHPDLPALHSRKTDAPDSWNTWTISEFAATTAKAAAGLQDAGLARETSSG